MGMIQSPAGDIPGDSYSLGIIQRLTSQSDELRDYVDTEKFSLEIPADSVTTTWLRQRLCEMAIDELADDLAVRFAVDDEQLITNLELTNVLATAFEFFRQPYLMKLLHNRPDILDDLKQAIISGDDDLVQSVVSIFSEHYPLDEQLRLLAQHVMLLSSADDEALYSVVRDLIDTETMYGPMGIADHDLDKIGSVSAYFHDRVDKGTEITTQVIDKFLQLESAEHSAGTHATTRYAAFIQNKLDDYFARFVRDEQVLATQRELELVGYFVLPERALLTLSDGEIMGLPEEIRKIFYIQALYSPRMTASIFLQTATDNMRSYSQTLVDIDLDLVKRFMSIAYPEVNDENA